MRAETKVTAEGQPCTLAQLQAAAAETAREAAQLDSRLMHLAGRAIALAVRAAHPTATAFIPGETEDPDRRWTPCFGYVELAGTTEWIPVTAAELHPDLFRAAVEGVGRARSGLCSAFRFERTRQNRFELRIGIDAALTMDIPGGEPQAATTLADLARQLWDEVGRHAAKVGVGAPMCKLTLSTEEWANGYFFSDIVAVDFTDGTHEVIDCDGLIAPFADDLEATVGGIGDRHTFTVEETTEGLSASGIGW